MGPLAPTIEDGDLARISPPIDFFGHNSYTRAATSPVGHYPTGASAPTPPSSSWVARSDKK